MSPERRCSGVCRLPALLAFAFALVLVLGGGSARAAGAVFPGLPVPATAEAPAEPPSPEQIRALADLLADDRVATWLRRQAERAGLESSATAAPSTPQAWLRDHLASVEGRLRLVATAWRDAPRELDELAGAWSAAMGEGETLRSLVYVVVFLVIGAGVEWLFWRYAGGFRRRIEADAARGVDASVRCTAIRAGLDAAGIALFSLGTLGGFLAFDWAPLVERVVLGLLLAVVTIRVLEATAVFVLCPRVPALRPIAVTTPVARFLHRWSMAVVAVATLGAYAALAIEETGMVPMAAVLMRSVTATAVLVLVVAAVWRWHARFRSRPAAAGGRRIPAELVPLLLSAMAALAWLLWLGGASALSWTVMVLAALVPADRAVRALVRGAAPDRVGVDLYRPVLERLARFALALGAALAVGAAWNVDVWALSESRSVAGRISGTAIDVLFVVLVADLLWVWARTAIDARLADYRPPEPGHAPGPEARLATLLPLARNFLMVTLVLMVALVALSSLGVNVGPLLAGAGVVGIAVGFGAQTLVRDIVSGVFFLLDDAFRVGEYIEIENLRGTVESISLRSMRLRHHRGAVHTIPFGEVKSLTNHSRDWVITKLEVRVPFDTDLKLVKKLVKQIGAELEADPEHGPSIIETLKSQGVRRMEEFNMVIGLKFMTRPGEQWVIRREVYQRIRDRFEAHGIRFAERNVKVEVIGAEDLTPEQRQAAVAAAQPAIERQAGAPGEPAPKPA
ncbi:MAG: mechanosensitive ion channel family protein [Ectothiorhodospiraceae bacterium]|nr:mechanosensitive ion channel family protein [Chromatiales bacterium]MCP5156272.1 mechanosensitive ion channel family protein [Ectothiorhodospiraceae bacterium]